MGLEDIVFNGQGLSAAIAASGEAALLPLRLNCCVGCH
jgi:hypothetical protein